jgi:hypothetical protein
MDVIYLPDVTERDFPALEELVHSKSHYIDWLRQFAHWREDAAAEGAAIHEIPVHAEAFRQYLDAKGFPYDRAQLLGFAEWAGKALKT